MAKSRSSSSSSPSSSSLSASDPQYLPGRYLSSLGLSNLSRYQYQPGAQSFIDKVFFNWFWTNTVILFPTWIAPNLMTAVSLLHMVIGYAVLVWHTPTLTEEAPSWVYYCTAVSVFIYQTLDGMDGKQARRTHSSSPLGQLFDHGCDALCCFLTAICVAATFRFGSTWYTMVTFFIHILPFFFANWEESVTHKMRFGFIAVSEAQVTVMVAIGVTGYYSTSMWMQTTTLPAGIPLVGGKAFEYRYLLMMMVLPGIAQQVISSIWYVWRHLQSNPSVHSNFPTVVQFVTYCILILLWAAAPKSIFHTHPHVFLFTIGVSFGYQVSRLIIQRVTDDLRRLDPYFYWILRPLVLVVANEWLPILFPSLAPYTIPRGLLTFAHLVWVLLFYSHFVVLVIRQICDYLGIQAFHIKPTVEDRKAASI